MLRGLAFRISSCLKSEFLKIHAFRCCVEKWLSLTNLLKILQTTMFRKVHKCFLVRVDAIDHIDRSNNELFVAGNKIPIGRSYKASLLGQLNLIVWLLHTKKEKLKKANAFEWITKKILLPKERYFFLPKHMVVYLPYEKKMK